MLKRRVATLWSSLALTACGPLVDIEGPHLARPPEGLGFQLNCQAARLPISSRPLRIQRCYVQLGSTRPDWVTISEHEGSLTATEIAGEHEAYVERWTTDGTTFSDLRPAEVDGAEGWYRLERDADGETRGCTLLVSWPDRCYAVEFTANRAAWKDEERLAAAVLSFRRDTPSRLPLQLAVGAVLVMASSGVFALRERARRQARHEEAVAEAKARAEERRRQAQAQAQAARAATSPPGQGPGVGP